MTFLSLLLTFIGAAFLIGLGIRRCVRIARAARAAGELLPGPADTTRNAVSVYGHAFKHPTLDTLLLLVGFVGGIAWVVAAPHLLGRLFAR